MVEQNALPSHSLLSWGGNGACFSQAVAVRQAVAGGVKAQKQSTGGRTVCRRAMSACLLPCYLQA